MCSLLHNQGGGDDLSHMVEIDPATIVCSGSAELLRTNH